MPSNLCACGSEKPRYDLTDARGIFCCYVCDDCEESRRARYRPEIFDDAGYDCDEEVDGDDEEVDEELEEAYFDAMQKDD